MATLVVVTKKINEIMKLMRKYSIGAFPNNMTMFKLSDGVVAMVDVCQMNQEDENNQTLKNFSKYFDVLLMMKTMKSRNVEVTIENDSQQPADDDMNIPLLKKMKNNFAGHRCPLIIIDDGAVARRVTYDDNNDNIIYLMMIKQNMMAILNIVHNSNNKKLTNNCKIEINTENINFSYYCDEYYEIILDVSVFLSQKEKVDIMREISGSIIIIMMENNNNDDDDEKLQSHIQSFIVTDENMIMQMITKSSISSQSNTNKSEYAFEKTLNNNNNNYNDKFYDVAINNDKREISIKSMMVMPMQMESTSKLYFLSPTSSHQQFFSFFMQLYPPRMITMMMMMHYDDSDAGYLMMLISLHEMQLNCQKSLQSFKESDQQSGIVVVSNNSCNNIKLMIHGATNNKQQSNILMTAAAANMEHVDTTADDDDDDRMNISELLFSHINDKNETLIDNTVNITCDFNYLNYKINNDKINDQIQSKDNVNVKDTTTLCKNNKKHYEESSNDIAPSMKHTANDNNYDLGSGDRATANSYTQIDKLIECQRREKTFMKQFEASGRRLRLCGGGGDSLSGGGASGWGSPPSNPSASNSNVNAGQWGATAQQQPPQQNWANQPAQQAAGGPAAVQQQSQAQQQNAAVGQAPPGVAQGQKPLTPSGGWNQPPQNPNQPAQQQQVVANPASGIVGGGTSAVAAKNQLEQLNSMREALFSQDGWSCQNVNQDTNWDVPGSPEPGPRGEPGTPGQATQWKSHNINNGTELWEANLRNGGQPPPQPVQKTPWNHTPTSNIGGTWGEDDDEGSESTSAWASNQNTQQPAPGWNQGGGGGGNSNNAANVWPQAQGVGGVNANIPKKDDWGSNVGGVGGGNSNWDPRGQNTSTGGPMDIRGIDPRDPRAANSGNVDMRMMEARDQMQGNLRGVTGRLGNGPDMWQQHAGIQGMPGMNKIVGPTAAGGNTANNPQWSNSQVGVPKDIDMNKTSGWDSSPPAARRPVDDGTSLWGQNRVPGNAIPGDSSWKGVQNNQFNRNPIGPAPPTGLPPSRLPGASIKPEGNSWGIHPGGNRSTWDENVHSQNWEDKSHLGSGGGAMNTPWNSEGPNAGPLWNKNKPSWPDNDISNDWPQQNKLSNTSSEIIRSSKPFRILAESGFKKDDVELALRNTNMNLDEAMELLQQQQRNSGIEPWHQQPTPGGFDHSPFPGNRYPGPQMPFPPNNPNKMPNANAGGPGANMGLNNIPMPFNKHLPHQTGAPTAFPQSAAASQSGQPSAHHLRNLVQQIQKAVQAGYLNHQILNQPLAPQTLQLLNSLLNAIQQLQSTQQSIQRNGGINSIQLQMTIQNQKKQISALQTQISQQQALYIKSQVGGNGGGGIGSADFLRQNSASGMGMGVGNHNDPIASLENNLSNLGLKNEASPYTSNTTSQQSRLNQWKLPSAIDNKATDPDFSRAPGTTSSKQSLPPTTPTSISSIGMHNEPSTWSSGRNDGGWPDSNIDTENKDWPSSNQSPAFTDLVPEFQPGKPWKGTQKNIEDDPSITPGSVARNPLSISAAKESELFGGNAAKTSPNEILSSSTWSFNPSTSTQQNFNSTMSKLGSDSKTNSWSDSTSELWAAPSGLGKSTGPPPGLGASKNGSTVATSESNDWMNWNSSNTSSNANGTWYSTWLLLKNLTTQIDGSTLRTLCVQHGPLQHFHLYLNHGIALCKYNSREEASKAQQALNNCVLSNTTICAESPSESEVQNILSHLGVPAGGNGGNGNGSTGSVSAGPNASTWRPPSQQSGPRAGSDSATWGSDWTPSNSAINW